MGINKGERHQYLSFMLDGEVFAVNIVRIKEIIECGHMTEVPMMPGYVRGIMNIRGQAVPVIDLRARFGREQAVMTKRTCTIILEVQKEDGQQDIGIMVDGVNEVLDVDGDAVEALPRMAASVAADFIDGVAKVGDRFVILLDINQLMAHDSVSVPVMTETLLEAAV